MKRHKQISFLGLIRCRRAQSRRVDSFWNCAGIHRTDRMPGANSSSITVNADFPVSRRATVQLVRWSCHSQRSAPDLCFWGRLFIYNVWKQNFGKLQIHTCLLKKTMVTPPSKTENCFLSLFWGHQHLYLSEHNFLKKKENNKKRKLSGRQRIFFFKKTGVSLSREVRVRGEDVT